MALHQPACASVQSHIRREREGRDARTLPIALYLRLAEEEWDRETAPEPIDEVDAYKRLRDLGYLESELRFAAGDR